MFKLMRFNTIFIGVVFLGGCQISKKQSAQTEIQGLHNSGAQSDQYFINVYGDTIKKIVRSEADWKMELNEKEFYVLRKKGTERAFTGDLLSGKEDGLYTCRGCGLPLFDSKHKFDSGTGWPSFFDVVDKNAIHRDTDYELGYPRTELTCNKCGGHLGHVFDDGPKPTGLRYCINSISLDFIKRESK